MLGQGAGSAEELQTQIIGLAGLVALAAGTAVEAGLEVKKLRRFGWKPVDTCWGASAEP